MSGKHHHEPTPSDPTICPSCTMNRRALIGSAAAIAAASTAASRASAQQASPVASPGATPANVERWDPNTVQPAGSFPLTAEPATLSVMLPSNIAVEDFATNEFTVWLEERTGVHVDWNVLPLDNDGSANTSLNVRLSSGDYGDIIMDFGGGRESLLQLYGSQGTFIPLNDLIDQHSIYLKKIFADFPAVQTTVTASDGNIYSVPDINDCFHCSMYLKNWINQEWLDTLGLDMPTTTEDYRAVLKAFKTQDPNGNGKADEFGLTGSNLIWGGNFEAFFCNPFLFHPGNAARLYLDAGEVKAVYMQDAFKDAITYAASLFADGVLDPELFTRDRDQARALGDGQGTGQALVGSICAGWWGEFTTTDGNSGGIWQQYTTMPPLEGPNGVRYSTFDPYQGATSGSAVITDKCANPELAIRWLDSLYELEATSRNVHGVKDRDWTWAEIGTTGINGQQAWWQSITNVSNLPIQNIHWSQSGPNFRSAEYRLSEYVPEEERPTNVEVILYQQTKDNYEPYAEPADMFLPRLYLSESDAQTVAEMLPTIDAHVTEFWAQCITGNRDVEAEWESFKQTAISMGLEQMIAIHQAAYDGSQG